MDRTSQAYEKAMYDLTSFKKIIYRRYEHPTHLNALDRSLMQVANFAETNGGSGIGRLIIEMPPRHGKTLTTSQYFPAWFLGRNPDMRVMLVSYGASLAHKNSRIARNLLRSPYYNAVFPTVKLADDSAAVDSWDIANNTGGVDALGIGGAATGKGAHVLIIDDPVKNRAEAESAVYRNRAWEAFTSDLYTRLEPGGVIILMATRWHVDDLTGRALSMSSEGWKRLHLPALASANDPIGREIGHPLWEERYPLNAIEKIQDALGEYEFSSLYQQNPLPSKGGLFDVTNIEVIDELPPIIKQVRFYDLAVTAKKHSDYTVGVKMAITKDETIIITHVSRKQLTAPDVQELIVNNAIIDTKECPIRLEAAKEGIIQLDYLLKDQRLRGYAIDAKAPQGDKYTRATPFSTRVKAGKVKLLRSEWNRSYLDELAVFPMGAHDDMVDASSGAYDMLATRKIIGKVRRA